jgi:hypothetical protein
MLNRSVSLFSLLAAPAALVGERASALASAGLQGFADLLRSRVQPSPLRNTRGGTATRSALLRAHEEVYRRSLSKYPNPVPQGQQPRAMARRRKQMARDGY